MSKNVYSSEVKWAVVKDKMNGQFTTREIVEKYGIKNQSQIERWMRWCRANEIHRFDQPIGKQYSYRHGPTFTSEEQKKDDQIAYLRMENDTLKVYGDEKGLVLQLVYGDSDSGSS